jgi:hypothetical protein
MRTERLNNSIRKAVYWEATARKKNHISAVKNQHVTIEELVTIGF